MDDESIPLSQLANEAFNPVAPHGLTQDAPLAAAPPGAILPTDFAALGAELRVNGCGAGPGPGSEAAAGPLLLCWG